ncbi:DUF3145 domain-containing protein [Humidisolicoccus flavus]|uniref:DUF3145 domain-containing protein n=1 Tax=Humidisolicoccus flavus TaxID=3111414 RepID=UPI0032515043
MATVARGVIYIHSAKQAVCPHLEWAIGRALGTASAVTWQPQEALPGTQRAELYWEAKPGSGAHIASALRGWDDVRFEVTEDPGLGRDGGRWMHTPSLGTFYAQTDTIGNMVIPEDRVRYAIEIAGDDLGELRRELAVALGSAWDEELETFRHASDNAAVVWLHKTG